MSSLKTEGLETSRIQLSYLDQKNSLRNQYRLIFMGCSPILGGYIHNNYRLCLMVYVVTMICSILYSSVDPAFLMLQTKTSAASDSRLTRQSWMTRRPIVPASRWMSSLLPWSSTKSFAVKFLLKRRQGPRAGPQGRRASQVCLLRSARAMMY